MRPSTSDSGTSNSLTRTVAGVTTLLEPLTATVLAVALFGERLGVVGGLGALLLVAALGLLVTDRR